MENNSKKTISVLGCGWLGLPTGTQLSKGAYFVKGSTTSPEKTKDLRTGGIMPFCLKVSDRLEGSPEDWKEFLTSDILLLNIPPGRRNPDVLTAHPRQVQLIIEKAKECGIKQVIFISSTGVYGDSREPIDEEGELRPARDSGRALVAAENYLRGQEEIDLTILRCAGLIGGERKAGRFFAGKKNVAGGSARVNMVLRRDVIRVIEEILRQEVWGETFNVCADEHPTKREYYTRKAEEEGFEPPVFAPDSGETAYKLVSNNKVKKRLGIEFSGI